MKKILHSLTIFITVITFTCCSDVLDLENVSKLDADRVWNDENLANAYLTNLYAQSFGNWTAGAPTATAPGNNWSVTLDQASSQGAGIHFTGDKVTITNDQYKRWMYTLVRLINEAVVNVDNGILPDDVKKSIISQALVLRAYAYFTMVVYHGGVPYLKVPLDRYEDDLYVKRNTTKECFEYIVKDLDDATIYLPQHIESTSKDFGRVDGNFAQALKAKILLYKASPQFNPSKPWDNSYWAEAYTANKAVYESLSSQGYALTPDYADIFLKERGTEVVFSIINSYPSKIAAWDQNCRPGSLSRDVAYGTPTWGFIKSVPMLDGKLYNDPTGKYYKSDNDFLQSYWENRDPRFDKTVLWNASVYKVAGKADGYRQYTSLGIADVLDDFGTNPAAKKNSTNLDRYSGFFLKKASDLSLTQAEVQRYDIDYIILRFAEVMLNYAETANETGHLDEALTILKAIRNRAGIEPGTDGNYGIVATTQEAMREAILAERNVEFCFEGKYFWDLRRLRMLNRLDGSIKHGVEAIAINPDGTDMDLAVAFAKCNNNELTEKDFRYVVHQIPFSGEKIMMVPPDKYYFFPIQKDVIDKNNNIEQNNNWGGTFNPTLE